MRLALVVLVLTAAVDATELQEAGRNHANPIRRVVTMLQMMQKKVEAEGEKEQELFDKSMCACKSGGASTKSSIEAAKTKIPEVESDIKAAEGSKAQLDE